jgi:5-methylcytosine-specific restriction protein A
MRRWRLPGIGLPTMQLASVSRARGGTWTRIAKHHKMVHVQCAHCGTVADLETDHIVPLHRGGTNDWKNLQSLCKSCHAIKSAREAGGA